MHDVRILDHYPHNHPSWLKPLTIDLTNVDGDEGTQVLSITVGRDKHDKIIVQITYGMNAQESATMRLFQLHETETGSYKLDWDTDNVEEDVRRAGTGHILQNADTFVMQQPAGTIKNIATVIDNIKMEKLL